MNQTFKTQIDGVNVEIQINHPDHDDPRAETTSTTTAAILTTSTTTPQFNIVKVGEGKTEEIAKVKAALSDGNKDSAALVQDLINSIESVPSGKDWWASKTVWVNAISILAAILTHFGITNFDLDAQMFDMAFPIIIAIINMWLRRGTNVPLSDKVVPFVDKK